MLTHGIHLACFVSNAFLVLSRHPDGRIFRFSIVDLEHASTAITRVTVNLRQTGKIPKDLMTDILSHCRRQDLWKGRTRAKRAEGLRNWWWIIKQEGLSFQPSGYDVWSFPRWDKDHSDVNSRKKSCRLMVTRKYSVSLCISVKSNWLSLLVWEFYISNPR